MDNNIKIVKTTWSDGTVTTDKVGAVTPEEWYKMECSFARNFRTTPSPVSYEDAEQLIVYATYGTLAHEKEPVYTADGHGEIYDAITVEIPSGITVSTNDAGETLLTTPDGTTYLANEILTNVGDEPALRWYDGADYHTVILSREVRHD